MLRDDNGLTLLHLASQKRYFELGDLLLRSGADVNLQDQEGRTALHLVAPTMYGEREVEALLTYGAIIDKRDNKGRTPLHYALIHSTNREGVQLTIQLLLEKGGYKSLLNEGEQSFTENKLKDSVVERALQMYWREPVEKILEHEPFYTALLLAGFQPRHIALPERLQRIQGHIEDTVAEWIDIEKFSISERRAMTSQVLQALPTLIELIKLRKKIVSPYLPPNYAHEDIKILKEFLFIPEKDCEESIVEVLKALHQKKSIPTEVVDLIQQTRVLGVFVDKLIDDFQLKRPAGDFLMTNGSAAQYMLFHKKIFSHNWKEKPCPPPLSLTSASP